MEKELQKIVFIAWLFTQYEFFVGTYNPTLSQNSSAGCMPCEIGMYCDVLGMSEAAGPCSAGYYCISGAQEATPEDGVNNRCPAGFYCLEGRY